MENYKDKTQEMFLAWFEIKDWAMDSQLEFFQSLLNQYDNKGCLTERQIDAGWRIIAQNEEYRDMYYERIP